MKYGVVYRRSTGSSDVLLFFNRVFDTVDEAAIERDRLRQDGYRCEVVRCGPVTLKPQEIIEVEWPE